MKTAQITTRDGLAALAIGIIGFAIPAQAQLITSNPSLPPLGGQYLNPDQVDATYGGAALQIVLSQPIHTAIADEFKQTIGPDEMERFLSTLDGNVAVLQNGVPLGTFPTQASGLVDTIVHGKAGNTTGTFQTEMLSMSLSGVSPLGAYMIRESPTLPSLGQTSITDIGGGLYRIDSFFDVFTELSIDGGATWMPDTSGPKHMAIVPEPASMSLLALGFASLAGFVRRRR